MEKFKGKKMFECGDAINALLEKYGLTLTGKVAPSQDIRPPWDSDGTFGIRYRVTLANTEGEKFTYNFWDSLYAKEHGEILKGDSVLETLLRECQCPSDYGDFCGEMGYDNGKEGWKTFNNIRKFKEGVYSVISEVNLEAFAVEFDAIIYP